MEEKDFARRIIELDESLDNIISFRAERLAGELHEFRSRVTIDGEEKSSVLGTTAKVAGVGAGLATAGVVGAGLHGARAGRFDAAAAGSKNPNMAKMAGDWKKKGLGDRFKSSMSNLSGGQGLANAKKSGIMAKPLQAGAGIANKAGGLLKKVFLRR